LLDKARYIKITNFIIDNIEGGYYHPDMLKDGRVKDNRYSSSGETMFGIDRKNGGSLNTSPSGKKFWEVIDLLGARKKWKWNYKGGEYEDRLKIGAASVMFEQYNKLASRYLSAESRKIIESDDRLLFNFIYATWNGSGWFKKFAEDFNEAVSKGTTNRNELVKVALNSRINSSSSLVRQGGNKIAKIIDQLKSASENAANEAYQGIKKNHIAPVLLISLGIAGLVYFTFFNKSTKLKLV